MSQKLGSRNLLKFLNHIPHNMEMCRSFFYPPPDEVGAELWGQSSVTRAWISLIFATHIPLGVVEVPFGFFVMLPT